MNQIFDVNLNESTQERDMDEFVLTVSEADNPGETFEPSAEDLID